MLLGIRWGSLHTKLFVWAFVPAAVILLAVAVVAVSAFQRAAEALVVERDRELTRLYASELSTAMGRHAEMLASATRDVGVFALGADAGRAELEGMLDRLAIFDGGVALVDASGHVIAASPEEIALPGADWSARPYFSGLLRTQGPIYSDIVPDGIGGSDVVAVAVPVYAEHDALAGAVVGMFRVGAKDLSAFYAQILRLPAVQAARGYVVDGRGRAIYHPEPGRFGADLSAAAPVAGILRGESGATRVRDAAGRDALASFAPVPGTAWGLVSEEDWAALAAGSRRDAQLLLVLLGLGIVVPALVVSTGVRRVTRPIADLIAAAREVAEGNFGRTIQAATGDEIETLAGAFNTMSKQLEASYRHLEQRVTDRTQELEARTDAQRRRAEQFRVIAEVGRRMTAIMPVDDLLAEIAREIQSAFGYYHVGIALVEGDHVEYRAGAGELWRRATGPDGRTHFVFDPARLKIGEEGVTGIVAGSGEALLLPDVSTCPDYVMMAGSQTRSELAVPIRAKGQVTGVLDVQSNRLNAFDDSDLMVLEALANQAGTAIENARLYAQARQLAVLEERQRMARDLHDSVTQSVYGVTLYADAAVRLLGSGDVVQAREHVRQLSETARAALQEMRLLIFELRPPELATVGLVAAIQGRLEAVEGRAGLKTDLKADGVQRAPPAVEEALYRIAQEALNNALKHARATNVRVTVRQDAGRLSLEVSDDGVGFDAAAVSDRGGLGMHSMAERAAGVGGRFTVAAAPGNGTHIRVEVPI